MKCTLIIFGLILNLLGHGQMVHNWVNTQYDPSEATEDSFVDLLVLNGGVKSIHEIQEYIGSAKEVSPVQVDIAFLRNGYLSSVHKILADSSESINEFAYSIGTESYRHHWISIFNFGVRKDTVRDEIYNGDQRDWQIGADSLAFDADSNIVYFRNKRDEVYTTYDKFGRKVKDSIPANPTLMAHEISYKYSKKKIIKMVFYMDQVIEIKTTYKLDEIGNWTKCTIKSNGRIKNAVLRREITYFD